MPGYVSLVGNVPFARHYRAISWATASLLSRRNRFTCLNSRLAVIGHFARLRFQPEAEPLPPCLKQLPNTPKPPPNGIPTRVTRKQSEVPPAQTFKSDIAAFLAVDCTPEPRERTPARELLGRDATVNSPTKPRTVRALHIHGYSPEPLKAAIRSAARRLMRGKLFNDDRHPIQFCSAVALSFLNEHKADAEEKRAA
jgi:hypothetical protein